jgi:hypothetical protein
MFKASKAFASFSTDDIAKAKEFYGQTLALKVSESPEGLELHPGDLDVFIYPKANHKAATFTVLNFLVDNIDTTVAELSHITKALSKRMKKVFIGTAARRSPGSKIRQVTSCR